MADMNTVCGMYDTWSQQDRQNYLDRAQEASKLTLPYLIPDEGFNGTQSLDTPWQSLGARGVNNLASKILLSLFPPNSPFMRFKVDEATLAKLGESTRGDLETGLTSYERVLTDDIEDSASRASMYQAGRHLIVGGNVLLFNTQDDKIRHYPLSRYVVRRAPDGTVVNIIALDKTQWSLLDEDFKAAALEANVEKKPTDEVDVYTWIRRDGNKWRVSQEVEKIMVPGSEGTYPLNASPWIPLRMTANDGEHYGRGYIEELFGDLNALDALAEAIAEGAGASAIVKFLVDPNGTTEVDDLLDTDNGGFCTGREQDISVLQVGKFADLRVAKDYMDVLEQRLSLAFLLNTAVQRNAERVTAEEIRFMAQELEDALGGIYSILAQELQLPLVTYRMNKLTKQKKLPKLPEDIKPTIITGLESLGRAAEHQRLRVFVGDVAQTFGPEVAAEYVKVDEYVKRSGAAMNVEVNGLVRTDKEVQQRQQQRAQMEAQAQAAAQQQPEE